VDEITWQVQAGPSPEAEPSVGRPRGYRRPARLMFDAQLWGALQCNAGSGSYKGRVGVISRWAQLQRLVMTLCPPHGRMAWMAG
jgi:hypothetical protein